MELLHSYPELIALLIFFDENKLIYLHLFVFHKEKFMEHEILHQCFQMCKDKSQVQLCISLFIKQGDHG